MGFLEVLGIVFTVLKLVEVIDWSWWLVLLPIYGPLSFYIIVIAVWAIFGRK